jgi:dephospho-CoA kinase
MGISTVAHRPGFEVPTVSAEGRTYNTVKRPTGIPVIGLIGGIGSGKSFVARHWAHQAPVVIVDGDAAGHEVLDDPTVQDELRRQFGDEVFHSDGRVNRRAMARRVFGADEEHQQARRMLEAVVHPRIRSLMASRVAAARQTPGLKAVIIDAALLLEAGWHDLCDALVFVDVPLPDRLLRVQSRGWTESDLRAREASQLPLDVKRRDADYVLDNSSQAADTLPPLDRLLSDIFEQPSA